MMEPSALSNGFVDDSVVTRRHGEARWLWIWRAEEEDRSFNIVRGELREIDGRILRIEGFCWA